MDTWSRARLFRNKNSDFFRFFFFRILRVSRVTRAGIALMADELEREWLRDHGEAGRDQGGAAVILLLHCFVDTAR